MRCFHGRAGLGRGWPHASGLAAVLTAAVLTGCAGGPAQSSSSLSGVGVGDGGVLQLLTP